MPQIADRAEIDRAAEFLRAGCQVYEVTKFGCCDAPPTYTYFSLRDGKKLRTAHTELNRTSSPHLNKRSTINCR